MPNDEKTMTTALIQILIPPKKMFWKLKEWTEWEIKLKKGKLKEWTLNLKEWTHTMKEWTKKSYLLREKGIT